MSVKPISISLSPNVEPDDIWLALRMLFQPWKWKGGKEIAQLEEEFAKYHRAKHAISFNSGRSALMAILESLGLQKDSPVGGEVLLQAFTCNAVPNPVIWAGLKPVYVDCREDDFNIDANDLEKKITPESKAVIIQHTFGIPGDIERIREICKKHNLIFIEDCAHALGATYQGKKLGTFGDVSFFSFSRDKIISSVYGGMAVTNNDEIAKKIRAVHEKVGYPSLFWTKQQLLHPILMNWLILPLYGIFGKYLLVFFQQAKILSKAVHWKEKRGLRPSYFPKAMPNALAVLALHQFNKLERLNIRRKELARFYDKALEGKDFGLPKRFQERDSVFLRYPIKHSNAHAIIKNAWAQNILLGDWYTSPIAPADTKEEKLFYVKGDCPVAEKLAATTLNLPTHINITEKEASKTVEFLKSFEGNDQQKLV